MEYPVETFSHAEREALRPHFTNLDRPVFALVNLPETVKGALFARYSRYQGTLRRLYLDEFTRYIPYDAPIAKGKGYRYWRDPSLGPEYESAMDLLFDTYSEALPCV